jgi:hypothetical protein
MPDHKEMDRRPTERERKVVFSPHESPHRQADGDPGRKPRPRLEPDPEKKAPAKEADEGETAGARGQWDNSR